VDPEPVFLIVKKKKPRTIIETLQSSTRYDKQCVCQQILQRYPFLGLSTINGHIHTTTEKLRQLGVEIVPKIKGFTANTRISESVRTVKEVIMSEFRKAETRIRISKRHLGQGFQKWCEEQGQEFDASDINPILRDLSRVLYCQVVDKDKQNMSLSCGLLNKEVREKEIDKAKIYRRIGNMTIHNNNIFWDLRHEDSNIRRKKKQRWGFIRMLYKAKGFKQVVNTVDEIKSRLVPPNNADAFRNHYKSAAKIGTHLLNKYFPSYLRAATEFVDQMNVINHRLKQLPGAVPLVMKTVDIKNFFPSTNIRASLCVLAYMLGNEIRHGAEFVSLRKTLKQRKIRKHDTEIQRYCRGILDKYQKEKDHICWKKKSLRSHHVLPVAHLMDIYIHGCLFTYVHTPEQTIYQQRGSPIGGPLSTLISSCFAVFKEYFSRRVGEIDNTYVWTGRYVDDIGEIRIAGMERNGKGVLESDFYGP